MARTRSAGVAVLLGLAMAPAATGAQQPDTLRLGLGDAVRLAAERSASVEESRLAERQGQASVADERAGLLPRLVVDASHGNRTFNTAAFGFEFPDGIEPFFDPGGEVLGPVTTIDVRAHLSQTLFDWGAIERVRGARAALEADRARTDLARERAAAAAATIWVEARRAADRLDARDADVALAEELLGVARELLAAGVGVRLDVTRAEAQLAVAEAERVTARAAAARADLALLRALNLPLDTPVALAAAPEPSGAGAEPTVATTLAGALGRRADVATIDRRIDAVRKDVAAVRAERWPTVSLGVADGLTGKRYGRLLNTYEWAVRVSVPVFDGRRRHFREETEQARAEALEVRRRELAEQVEFEIRDAALRMRSAAELVTASDARFELARAELAQARDRFRAGVAGSGDVVTASLKLNQARAATVDARASLAAARVLRAIAEGAVLELR